MGPKDELLYLGPRQGAKAWFTARSTAERDGLRIDAYYTGWADTGVFTREALVTNTGRLSGGGAPVARLDAARGRLRADLL